LSLVLGESQSPDMEERI